MGFLFGFDSSTGSTGVLAPPRRGSERERRESDVPDRFAWDDPPPAEPPEHGGDGGRGDGDEGEGDPAPLGHDPDDAASFAVTLLLLGIATLFLVFLGAFVLLRRNAPEWPPPGTPTAPHTLWISTLVLAASSLSMTRASRAAAARRSRATRNQLRTSVLLGLGFVACQSLLWTDLWHAGLVPSSSGYATIFYALTGIHALHVVVGLGLLGWVHARAKRADAERFPRTAIRLSARYWHFMGAVWLVLFAVLYFVR